MSWEQWLNKEIESAYGPVPRRQMIHEFVKYGLIPFIQAQGYQLNGDLKRIQSILATGLYENQFKHNLESTWLAPTNEEYDEEDLDHFNMVMDLNKWDDFWENWGAWEDVDPDSRLGPERRLDIQNFVWQHVDVAGSKQTKIVDKFFEEDEPQDEGGYSRRHEDVYIRDMSESNEWGGYRR
jgi:hypothetical protein